VQTCRRTSHNRAHTNRQTDRTVQCALSSSGVVPSPHPATSGYCLYTKQGSNFKFLWNDISYVDVHVTIVSKTMFGPWRSQIRKERRIFRRFLIHWPIVFMRMKSLTSRWLVDGEGSKSVQNLEEPNEAVWCILELRMLRNGWRWC
jgi:hypothetical protein